MSMPIRRPSVKLSGRKRDPQGAAPKQGDYKVVITRTCVQEATVTVVAKNPDEAVKQVKERYSREVIDNLVAGDLQPLSEYDYVAVG
jgi:hypothetical protein